MLATASMGAQYREIPGMFEGRILLQGTSQELAQDPVARQIYLGERFRLD